jgi:hypothetical protein
MNLCVRARLARTHKFTVAREGALALPGPRTPGCWAGGARDQILGPDHRFGKAHLPEQARTHGIQEWENKTWLMLHSSIKGLPGLNLR